MKRTLLVTAVAIAVSLMMAAPAAHADAFTFVANLTQALEVPATGSSGTGFATVVLDTVANTMQVDVTFSGLSSCSPLSSAACGTTASHIHCCLLSPFLTGINVGVATTLPTFTGFPLGVTSGTYDHLFDLTAASSYNPAFDGGSVASQEATLVAGIETGETYLNIHTTNFTGGEIRGFLVPTPEPSTLLLLGVGLTGLLFLTKKIHAQKV